MHYISAGKLRRYHGESLITKIFDVKTNLLNARDFFRLAGGTVQSYFLLKRLKPSALLLKGGFVCVPVAFAARFKRVPYITHDSDALPGLSNRIAARWASYNATGMPAKYYPYPAATVKYVGVPTDERFRKYSVSEENLLKEEYGFAPDNKILLITGGSLGARRLNSAVLEILPKLLKNHSNLRVLHQIGEGNEDQIARFPEELKAKVFFFSFSLEIFHMSAIAELVVARAGASAMADYASQSKACIVVPNPYLAGGHQLKNAQVYMDAQAVVVVNEKDLPAGLYEAIEDLLKHPEKRVSLSENLHTLTPSKSAAASLAELLCGVAS